MVVGPPYNSLMNGVENVASRRTAWRRVTGREAPAILAEGDDAIDFETASDVIVAGLDDELTSMGLRYTNVRAVLRAEDWMVGEELGGCGWLGCTSIDKAGRATRNHSVVGQRQCCRWGLAKPARREGGGYTGQFPKRGRVTRPGVVPDEVALTR